MKRLLFLPLCLAAGCMSQNLKPGEAIPTYTLPDWPAKITETSVAASAMSAVAVSSPSFHVSAPAGYHSSHGVLSAPIAAMFIKELPDGEAALLVERYLRGEEGFQGKNAFIASLGSLNHVHAVKKNFAGREFQVYEGIEFKSLARRIPPADSYADRLGSNLAPPRLNLFEERRFPKGGEAYRFYRCRKEGAWSLLRKYRRLRQRDADLSEFRAKELGTTQRGMLSACFGQAALLAVETGGEVPDIPKPSMHSLRIMAQEEWAYGASQRVEREAVVLIDVANGFYALRLRSPRDFFAQEFPAFAAFAASLDLNFR